VIAAFTGHRPDKLPNKETGYKLPNPTYIYVCQQIEKVLKELKPEKTISGMALGSDQWLANISHKLNIPFIAAVPFEGQEMAWPAPSQKIYQQLLKLANEIVVVSPGSYEPRKMQIRNEWMVNCCDTLIAVWDGSSGGTGNCVRYAQSINKNIIHINPLNGKNRYE
jgi:uncharacterized phage-like protein YoqJ